MITPAQIIDAVSKVTGVGVEDIVRRTRVRHITLARQLYFYVAKKRMPWLSLKQIGEVTSIKDHTTVKHGIGTMQDMIDTEPEHRIKYARVLEEIGIEKKSVFTLNEGEYLVNVSHENDKLVLNQDGSIIVMTVDNIRQLYLATI